MHAYVQIILASLTMLTVTCFGAESDFYRTFLASMGTNAITKSIPVTSPLLVDTTNKTPKVAGFTNSLTIMRDKAEVSGVHVGMNMSQVVAQWGKPPRFYSQCHGGPHFAYSDVGLNFAGDCLMEIYIPTRSTDGFFRHNEAVYFEQNLSEESNLETIVALLGPPKRRLDDMPYEYLVYENPTHALVLASRSLGVSYIRLLKRGSDPFRVH